MEIQDDFSPEELAFHEVISRGIQYAVGDATDPQGPGPKIIAHVVNDRGGWGRGFVTAISKRWPEPEKVYRKTFREGCLDLGDNSDPILVAPDLYVVNMVAQQGYSTALRPALRKSMLDLCLGKLAHQAKGLGASVHCPRIGCGLGGGDWDKVATLIHNQVIRRGVPVTVYDLG